MTATTDSPLTRRAVLASAGAGAGAAALGGTPARAQTAQRKTFVLVHGASWRLVLAAGVGLAGAVGPQGVHSHADRRRRALAPYEQGYQSRHPHHRHRQCYQMGGPHRHVPSGPFLRRLAGLGLEILCSEAPLCPLSGRPGCPGPPLSSMVAPSGKAAGLEVLPMLRTAVIGGYRKRR
jgi:hypothetical protein